MAVKKEKVLDYARFDRLVEELSVSTMDMDALTEQIAAMLTAENEPQLKLRFHIHFVARRLCPTGELDEDMLARAKQVLAKKNASSKAADRRTAAEEDAYTASRAAWSRIRKKAGVAPADNRGGARSFDPVVSMKRQVSGLIAHAQKYNLGDDIIALLERLRELLD